jgi:lambda repressor-like predicted transcriptional regulator
MHSFRFCFYPQDALQTFEKGLEKLPFMTEVTRASISTRLHDFTLDMANKSHADDVSLVVTLANVLSHPWGKTPC